MTYKGAPLMSERHDWETPPAFITLSQEHSGVRFDLDAAAAYGNNKAPAFFDGSSEEQDGLLQPWFGTVWVNPPFGRTLADWFRKAAREIQRPEVERILMLVPARVDTRWFHDEVMPHAWMVWLIRGRFTFGHSSAVEGANAPFPSMLVDYRKHRLPSAGIEVLDVPKEARGFGSSS